MFADNSSSPDKTWDVVMATSNIAFTLCGFIGNCFAFGFFLGKTDLVSRLYQHINIIDIVICLGQVPVIQVLLTDRRPGMFNSQVFCGMWAVIYRSSTKLYAMAVLLLSFSRTIAIVYPFYQIKKRPIFVALYVYIFYLAVHQAVKFGTGFSEMYSADVAYCYPYLLPDSETQKLTDFQSKLMTAEYILVSLETGLPIVLIVINFCVIVIKLLFTSKVSSTGGQQRKAAITIAIFTGVFLCCYLPLSIFFALYAYTSSNTSEDFSPSSGIFKHFFTFWYVWPLCECVLNALNAALDFTVFLTRVRYFRDFLFKSSSPAINTGVQSTRNPNQQLDVVIQLKRVSISQI